VQVNTLKCRLKVVKQEGADTSYVSEYSAPRSLRHKAVG
jgi:hypothetical protein